MFDNSYGGGKPPRRRLSQLLGFGGPEAAPGMAQSAAAPAAPNAPSAPQAVTGAPGHGTPPAATGVGNPGRGGGGGFDPERMQKRMGRLAWSNAQRAQEPLWNSIQGMLDYGSHENRANALAPEMEAISRFENRAQGQSLASMLGRGLDESSYGGAVEGAIATGANDQRVGAIRNRNNTEQSAQAANAAFLSAIQSGNLDAASRIAESMREADLMRQQLDAQNDFNWGDLGSLLGSVANIGIGGAWRPSRTKTKLGKTKTNSTVSR